MQRQSKAVDPAVPSLEAMWNLDSRSIETVMTAYRAWFSQANRMRDETMRFAHERFTKELDAVGQLARCLNPNEALVVQTEFAKTMVEAYLLESQKLVELIGDMAKAISSSPKSGRAHH